MCIRDGIKLYWLASEEAEARQLLRARGEPDDKGDDADPDEEMGVVGGVPVDDAAPDERCPG